MILRFSLVLLSVATARADQRGLVGRSRVLHNINKHQGQLETSAECEWSGEKHCIAQLKPGVRHYHCDQHAELLRLGRLAEAKMAGIRLRLLQAGAAALLRLFGRGGG